jgi:hypothetical protein
MCAVEIESDFTVCLTATLPECLGGFSEFSAEEFACLHKQVNFSAKSGN